MDNRLVAFEIFHSMNGFVEVTGSMSLVLDMVKACDQVERIFLRRIMHKLGYDWVNLMMKYVKSFTLFFTINGEAQGYFKPS